MQCSATAGTSWNMEQESEVRIRGHGKTTAGGECEETGTLIRPKREVTSIGHNKSLLERPRPQPREATACKSTYRPQWWTKATRPREYNKLKRETISRGHGNVDDHSTSQQVNQCERVAKSQSASDCKSPSSKHCLDSTQNRDRPARNPMTHEKKKR